jgi:hypothetical protein
MRASRASATPLVRSTLSVEMVGASSRPSESSSTPQSPRLGPSERKETLAAVAVHGGLIAGPRLSPRERTRRLGNSLGWQSGQLLACLVDLIVLFVELSSEVSFAVVNTITALVLLVFVADLALRTFTYRKALLRSCWAYVDFSIVGASLLLFVVGVVAEAEAGAHETSSRRVGTGLRGLVVALRWLRALRATAMLVKTGVSGRAAARQKVSSNKRRFVDLDNGFDLDLAYVTDRLIAMSVPATGVAQLYRNPLREVARFFESRHSAEGYLIINLCPELPYAADRFVSGSVHSLDVQDHTPPTMAQFVEFVNASSASWQRGRALAVHCRGGKGRTGSVCCAWLLYTRDAVDADDALAAFALARTELGLNARRLQGVDTPSQKRYVHQMGRLLESQGAYLSPSTTPAVVRLPESPLIELAAITLHSWFVAPPVGPLVAAVHTEDATRPGPVHVTSWSAPVSGSSEAVLAFDLGGVPVQGDVRVSIFSLPRLLEARSRRMRAGKGATLPFDKAARGPWGVGGSTAAEVGASSPWAPPHSLL